MNNVYLAIDYGRAHIGLAYAEHILAIPLPSLNNDKLLITNLQQIIKEYQVNHLIIGMPSGVLVEEIKRFGSMLAEQFKLPISFYDETLSSIEAKTRLIQANAARHKRMNEHSYAAAVILEDYLETMLH